MSVEGGGPRGSVPGAAALVAYSALRQGADACQALAVGWYLGSATGSARLLGLAWVASGLPWLLLPLSGAAADRTARRRLVVAGDLAVAALAAAAALGRPAPGRALGFLALYGLGYAAVRPATKGLAREAAPAPAAAARLSGLLTALEYAALVAAQLAAGRWLLPRGPAWGLGAAAVLLVAGAAVLRPGPARPAPGGDPPALRRVAGLLLGPELRGPLLLTVACGTCGFALLPLAPLLAGAAGRAPDPVRYGLLMAAYSLGAAGGAGLARRADGWRLGVRGAALAWLGAAPALFLAPRLPGAAAAACYAAVGIAAGFQDAGNAARVAAAVPAAAQSQAMALGSLVWRVPAVLAGTVVAAAGSARPAALCGILAAALAVVAAGAACLPPPGHAPRVRGRGATAAPGGG